MMTSKQRVMAALNHIEPDRTPIFEYALQPPVVDVILGRSYIYGQRLQDLMEEKGFEQALKQQAIDIVSLAKILGHDMLYVVPNPVPEKLRKKTSSVVEDTCHLDDPVEEMIRRINHAKENLAPLDEAFLIYRLVREEIERNGLDLPILAPACGHGVWADTVLMQSMVLAPEVVYKYFELITKSMVFFIEKYLEFDIEMIDVGGDFAGNKGPLISPDLYRKFIVPEIHKLSQYIHTAGKDAVNASDGNLWSVIDDFLIGCDVDGYIEIDLRAGMDLLKLKKRFGSKITFFGNIDCANILSFGTPEQVKEHTKDCILKGMGNGGHILCCNNAITESIPIENYMAIIDAYHEYFGL